MKAFLISLLTIVTITAAFSQKQEDHKKKVQEFPNLSESEKQTGDIKEATRYHNEAATLVWEDKNYADAIMNFNQSIELNKLIKNESGSSKIREFVTKKSGGKGLGLTISNKLLALMDIHAQFSSKRG